ncbi:MAG: VWA domain-containing protein [Pyrinomonadaceae bacterium]|nr:VWA domain-containing protein [Pyrinomonadaceae bacterium]
MRVYLSYSIMRYSKVFLFTLIFLFSFLDISAQDDDVIKVDSSIVRLNVGVVDQKGRPITSLTKENFTIYENGVKQNIARFEPTVAPFSVVMILDMSGSTKSFRDNIRFSALRFLDALAPDDRVAVIEFYKKVNLLNDFTTDRKIVAHSIGAANGVGDTQLYKALKLALEKLAKEGSRRKAIVVLTDGVDTELRNSDRDILSKFDDAQVLTVLKPETNEILNRTLNQSDAEGVTIYPLALPTGDPAKLADPTPRQIALFQAARARLEVLAKRTGGTLNKINRLEEMSRLYAEVAADLRTLYTIEYQSSNDKRDGKWRDIKIETSSPELISRTRQGYFAK